MAKTETRTFTKFLKTMLVVLLIVAASIGATLYYSSQGGNLPFASVAAQSESGEDASAPPPAASRSIMVPPPIFLSLEPFTVTLRTERSSRILHVAITLRLGDEASRQVLVEYMPEVRDRILRKLSEQHPVQVQTPEGRLQLVDELRNTLMAQYSPQPRTPVVDNVLFTAFVVQ